MFYVLMLVKNMALSALFKFGNVSCYDACLTLALDDLPWFGFMPDWLWLLRAVGVHWNFIYQITCRFYVYFSLSVCLRLWGGTSAVSCVKVT